MVGNLMSYHGEVPGDPAQTVFVNATTPATATIFDTNSPPTTHTATLMADMDNLYVGTDGSVWIYNGTAYVTAPEMPSTEWYLAGTATDAGANKTAAINRTGKVGISTTTGFIPVNALDVNNSFGVSHVTVSTTPYTLLATDVVVRLTSASVQSVVLPSAAISARRVVTLVNPTSAPKDATAYGDLLGVTTAIIPANSVVVLQSTGTDWVQIGGTNYTSYAAAGITLRKKMTADVVIVNWVAPWTRAALTELDIVVPAGQILTARYTMRCRTSNGAYVPTGYIVRGFNAADGDLYTARQAFPNSTAATATTGGNWYDFWFNEARPDNSPPAGRQIDSSCPTNIIFPCYIDVVYENKGAAAKTFGFSFGCENDGFALNNANLTHFAGSVVEYTLA